ncbi:LppU/SCO3897 family protein [Streptomyces chartreusis]|uniref:LppU/SCO3897 family protein n=1 Tax=Streptomyces chartreusis TaxID=1969 RepID=UPI003F4E2EDB
MKAAVVVIAIVGGLGYYVWDYNTSPTGGKAKAEASASAAAEEAKTHDPEVGDCVKVADPKGKPVPTVVDCGSPEAEYKMGEMLPGQGQECSAKYDYGIQYYNSRGFDYTLCFTKVRASVDRVLRVGGERLTRPVRARRSPASRPPLPR